MDKLVSNKFAKQEKEFLADVEEDYVSLGEVVGICLGHYKALPTEEEYLETLDFLKYLMDKYGSKLKYYLGPGVTLIDKTPEDLLVWLKEVWHTRDYEGKRMDYSIWFDLDLEETEKN